METRQLAAFCEVVERRSFSLAAERLGVTQPAISLQIRSLEKKVGTQLLDRSGRKVGPTEAGLRFYRSAQRILALEEQMLEDASEIDSRELAGTLEIGASTGPGGSVVATLLCEFHRENRGVRVSLSVFDTQRVVELVADRQLELGIVGAAPRRRGVEFEPFLRDEVVLVCAPGHPFAGRTVSLDELREETLIVMQDGAGVRQVIEGELRMRGIRLADLDVMLELGLQESVKTAVERGFGVSFISRTSIEAQLAAGTVATAQVEGFEVSREVSLVRATDRTLTRAAQAFVEFAHERLRDE